MQTGIGFDHGGVRGAKAGVQLTAALALACVVALAGMRLADQPISLGSVGPTTETAGTTAVAGDMARLPLSFEPNRGVADRGFDFLSRGSGYSLGLAPTQVALSLRGSEAEALTMDLVGASAQAPGAGEQRLAGTVNYLRGDDPSRWQTNVPTFGSVAYAGVYDGVDVRYYGRQGQFEYDFELAPHANPNQIALDFEGARSIELTPGGDLLLRLDGGTLREHAPVAYQRAGGERVAVEARYVLDGDRVRFALGDYDRARPLTIDPLVLAYATFLGGNDPTGDDYTGGVAVDSSGSAYVSGLTSAADFPVTPGADDTTLAGDADAYVAKLTPNGDGLVYATFIGGSSFESSTGIDLGADGSAFVSGETFSNDFPATPGAFRSTPQGDTDGFVAKLTPAGNDLTYATYVGGLGSGGPERVNDIAVDSSGAAVLAGQTPSTSLPTTTPTTFDPSPNGNMDGFVIKLNPSGSNFVYSSYLGGDSRDVAYAVALDASGSAYFAGETSSSNFPESVPVGSSFDSTLNGSQDAFVTKIAPSGAGPTAITYSGFLGGVNDTAGIVYDEQATGIALDASNAAYVVGSSPANDFPATPGAFDTTFNGQTDGFAAKISPSGGSIDSATMIGGAGEDYARDVAINADGRPVIGGIAGSAEFPLTADAFDASLGGPSDTYAAVFSAGLQNLITASLLGGSSFDFGGNLDLDPAGNAYVVGSTGSKDFPATAGAFDTGHDGLVDGYAAKIALDELPPVVKVTAKKKQSYKAVKTFVLCAEPCGAEAAGSVKVKRAGRGKTAARAKGGKLVPAAADLVANQLTRLKLKAKGKTKRAIKRALGAGGKATAKITVTATDRAGLQSSDKVKVKLK